MLRSDISKAISQVPPIVSEQITTSCTASLDLLNTYLPADEAVVSISSASPKKDGQVNSLLALTDRRLIFVAPAPQARGGVFEGHVKEAIAQAVLADQ